MRNKYFLLINLLVSSVASPQQIPLTGTVSIQNSEYITGTKQYVSGASVSADFAKDRLTDSYGIFVLEFVSEGNGKSTKLKVFKAGLEIVNQKALEDVIIGRTSALKIYMCEKGKLVENQAKYYKISLDNLYAEKDRRIAILEKGGVAMQSEIKRLKIELNTEIYTRKEAITLLNQQIEDLEKKLPEFVKKLATVNLDDAGKLYQRAFKLYTIGNIKEAISVLDIDKLLTKGLEATTNLESLYKQGDIIKETIALLKQEIKQTVKNLEFGAELSNQDLKFQETSEYYKTIITILERDPKGKDEDKGDYSHTTGDVLAFIGRYSESLKYYQKALGYHQKVYKKNHPKIANDYSSLGSTYRDLNLLEKSLEYQKRALDIRQGLYEEFHPLISDSYNKIANVYIDMDSLNIAMKYQRKALAINLVIHKSPHQDIARDYHDLARVQYELERHNVAIININKALAMKIELLGDENLSLMGTYGLQGLIYMALRQLDKALISQKKALKIFKPYFDETHPQLPIIYNNIAATYQDLGILDTALTIQKKAVKLYKPIDSSKKDKKLIFLNRNLSDIQYSIGKQQFALKNYQEAIPYFKAALEHHWDLSNIYNYLGICFMKLKKYSLARGEFFASILREPSISRDVFLVNIGISEAKTGDFYMALRHFEEYKKRNPNNGKAYRNYAMYHALQNQPKKAIEMLQKAIELGYDDIEWLKTDDSMDSLRSMPEFQELLKKLE